MNRALHWLSMLGIVALLGCGGAWSAQPPPEDEPLGSDEPADTEPSTGSDQSAGASGSQAGGPQGATDRDAPEISRSAGEQGGMVVFWPRVIPRTDDADIRKLAGELQQRLVAVANKAAPNRKLDVRPEPERVCPRDGCAAMTLGVLLLHLKGGCTALGLVSGPGRADQRIVPWAGVVKLKHNQVPFREHPENQVTIRDAMPCKDLLGGLDKREGDIVKAISDTARR